MSTAFRYHPRIFELFPQLCAGVILADGLGNCPSSPPLQQAFLLEQQAALQCIGDTPLSEIPSLAAWRAAFRQFGVDPTKHRSAAEALLRRLVKKGDVPSINALVDICNLVSIRYALPVAAFDARGVHGAITVHLARGDERYVELGQQEPEYPEPGEVVFSDEQGLVVARRWCWRQSDHSAARPDTRQAIITLEAQHEGARDDIQAALTDLLELLPRYLGGKFTWGVLDASRLEIST
ncbi:MAG: phenylalanine--tRNA ligase beta subunit-related protein [Anaerolineales bacterium]|nr:phenylalanine--tRNA ligase beta subunit-related protein [Anaerolineales bacterium]